jgi:hypothetical protein
MQDPRLDQSELIRALEARGAKIKGKSATCPWHDDKTPSASMLEGQDGRWRLFCHVCDRSADVLDLVAEMGGKPVSEALKEIASPVAPPARREERPMQVLPSKQAVMAYAAREGKAEEWYTYGPKDKPALIIARIIPPSGKKTFRQFTPVQNGYVPKNLIERGKIPLYRVGEITGTHVLVTEGERKTNAARALGLDAVSAAMGALKADFSDWSPLKDKIAVLWPDNDETGRKHMAQVAEILNRIGTQVYTIDSQVIGLQEKGDIIDFLALAKDKTDAEKRTLVEQVMSEARGVDPLAEFKQWAADVKAGRWETLPLPMSKLARMSRVAMPGTLALVCADPGAGKSFALLQIAQFWVSMGIKVAVRMLEDESRVHLNRVLAQLEGCAALTDDKWIKENSAEFERILAKHERELQVASRWITAESSEQPSLDDLCQWVEDQARNGCRVVIVDPITACKTSARPWEADFTAAMRLKKTARDYACTVILTTHPRGLKSKMPDLGSMAGGSAWARFCHCALWIERTDGHVERRDVAGNTITINRIFHITKCRHGRGSGQRIGMLWGDDARFQEIEHLANEDKAPAREYHSPQPAAHKPRTTTTPDDREDHFKDTP